MAETEYLLDFAKRLGYLKEKECDKIEDMRKEVGKLLWNFYKKVTG
jgi:four helix bundle protein